MTSSATMVRVHLPPSLNHVDAHDGGGDRGDESSSSPPPPRRLSPSPSLSESFAEDGFVVLRDVLDGETVRALNERLRAVLEGTYDRGNPPDKCPQRPPPHPPRTLESRNGGDPRGRRGGCDDDCDGAANAAERAKVGLADAAAQTGAEGAAALRMEDHDSSNNSNGSSGDGGRGDGGNEGRGGADNVGHSGEEPGGGTLRDRAGGPHRNGETSKKDEANRSRHRKKKGTGKGGGIGNNKNHKVRVVQVINVHKSDALFRSLAVSPELGRIVSNLADWYQYGGARLAQDQVWAKPPGSPPLTYHRDSPYFMFTPDDVVTVWVALDDMDVELGPLEYVRGSHRWGEGGGDDDGGVVVVADDDSREATKNSGGRGSASRFFPADRGIDLLRRAAEAAGDRPIDLVSMSGLKAGDISIHHGKTWHGSGPNLSSERWRRGLGLHYVPRDVRFTEEAVHSSLWRKYVVGHANGEGDVSEIELDEEDFPVVWSS